MRTQKITFLLISLLLSWLSMSAQYELTVLSHEDCNFAGNQGRLQISAIGETGPYEVTWPNGQQQLLENNTTAATLNNLAAGTYNVAIKNKYGCEKILTKNIISQGFNCGAENRIGDIANMIEVYPNPFTQQFTLSLKGKANKIDVKILDMTGALVDSKSYNFTGNEIDIDAAAYPAGIYQLSVAIDDLEPIVQKIVKIN